MQADARTVVFAFLDRLELQGGMRGVLPQQRIVTPSELLNMFRQRIKTAPEPL